MGLVRQMVVVFCLAALLFGAGSAFAQSTWRATAANSAINGGYNLIGADECALKDVYLEQSPMATLLCIKAKWNAYCTVPGNAEIGIGLISLFPDSPAIRFTEYSDCAPIGATSTGVAMVTLDSLCDESSEINPITLRCIAHEEGFYLVPPLVQNCPITDQINPCDVATGNKLETETDYQSAGLRFERIYNSMGPYRSGPNFAHGWRHTYSRSLDEVPDKHAGPVFAASSIHSQEYDTELEACETGWGDIKDSVWGGDLSTATATFSGGDTCEITDSGSLVAFFAVKSNVARSGFVGPSTIRTITRPNGTVFRFRQSGSSWINELVPSLKLEQSGSDWIFTDTNDTRETYNSSGQLVSIENRNGQVETLDYDSTVAQGGDDNGNTLDRVTGPFGHEVSFAYDANGRPATVTTPDGAIQYGYDGFENLVSATYPDTSVRQYVYEEAGLPNHLTGVIDENGDRYSTFAYGSDGRATLSEHAGGKERVTLAYNVDGTTTLLLGNGATRTYWFDVKQGSRKATLVTGDVCSICPGGNVMDRSFDSNGYTDEVTDWEGNVTQTLRNNEGLVETLIEGKGSNEQRTSTTTWNTTNRLPDQVVSAKNTTDYGYDADGNLLTLTISSGALSRTLTITYNAHGQPLTINGPRTDVSDITTLAYYVCTTGNECGQLQTVTNALSQVTTYNSYDAAGRPTLITNPNGLQIAFTYDTRGQVLTATQTPVAGTPRTATMTYDDVGQLETLSTPDGVLLTFAYTAAHYVASVTDNLGNHIDYDYDAMGNLSDEDTYDPSQVLERAVDYAYDLNNRLDTVSQGGFLMDLSLDLVGNLTSETDPTLASTQHSYDALNRLDQTIDALTGIMDYTYDDHDNLTSVTAANGAQTTYVYDDLDNLTQETSPDRGLLTYTYDSAGNRLTQADARGVTATYAYDALNRLTSVTYPNTAENVTYTYDDVAANGIGRLTSISDQSGITSYTYNDFGNVLTDQRQIAGIFYTTSYDYDGANNVSSMTYPSGRVVDYLRDTAGQVTQVSSLKNSVSQTLVSNIGHQPFGPISSLTYGNGVVFDYQYGLDSRVTSITSIGIAGKQYNYDAAGNVSSILDSLDAELAQSFEYDALGRLTSDSNVSNDDLVTYLSLGETSGSSAIDATGQGHDGVYTGTVSLNQTSLVAGGDAAIRINTFGSGYVDGPTLTGTTVTGIEGWFQTDNVASFRAIVSLHNTTTDRIIVAQLANSGQMAIWQAMTGWVLYSDGNVSSNEPHHFALWYEAGTNKTYFMIDGITQQNTYTGDLLAVNNPKVYIGAYNYQNNVTKHYLGEIDDIVVYDTAVDASTFANRTAPVTVLDPTSNAFSYDANGNRSSVDDGTTVQTLAYQAQSNELASIDSVTVQHDLSGNRTADPGGVRTYTYHDSNRLSAVLDNSITIADYTHNALGQRTNKSANGADVVYLYDLFGNLVAEHTNTGVHIRDYVWLDGKPVTQIDQGEVFSYLHYDHLNSPRLATNDAQAIVWRWDSDAFGSALPDEDPDSDSNATTINLRFPGQYYDAETGFHYNYFRTYDPSTGRYLESDPIGLAGGINSYGYVGNNSLGYIDPLGLFSTRAHNELIQRYGDQNGWPATKIQAVKKGSKRADSWFRGNQFDSKSYMHAMTSAKIPDKAEACRRANEYISEQMSKSNDVALGMALHTIMDNRSPAHTGFQYWDDTQYPRHGDDLPFLSLGDESEEDLAALIMSSPELIENVLDDMSNLINGGVGIDCSCYD